MKKILAAGALVAVGIAGRLVPHLPNATPVTAITYAGGKYLGKTWAVLIPLAAMVLSDVVIGFYDWKVLLSVYASFAAIGALSGFLKKVPNGAALTVLAAPFLFFIITNFAVWLTSPWYAKTLAGLFECFVLGLPFLRNMFFGDAVFTFAILRGVELRAQTSRRDITQPSRAEAHI